MINKNMRSACCNAPVREETWISKTVRRIYFCTECDQPTTIRTQQGLFDSQKSKDGEK